MMEHIELSRCNHREREFDGSAKGEVMGGDQLDYTDGMDFNLLGNEQTHMFTHSPSMSLLKTTIQFLCDTQQSNTDLINHKAFITVSSAVSCLWTPTNWKHSTQLYCQFTSWRQRIFNSEVSNYRAQKKGRRPRVTWYLSTRKNNKQTNRYHLVNY